LRLKLLKMEVASSSETLVPTYESTRRLEPEGNYRTRSLPQKPHELLPNVSYFSLNLTAPNMKRYYSFSLQKDRFESQNMSLYGRQRWRNCAHAKNVVCTGIKGEPLPSVPSKSSIIVQSPQVTIKLP
jgi:hypothetical protein